MHDLVIENGTVVDGTGAGKFATDARPGRLIRGAQRPPA